MTIEEAIKELLVLWERMKRAKEIGVLAYKTIMYYDGQYVEALDIAIQALEQQEQQTAHFIGFENPNYSPFNNSPKVLLKCSECGNAVLSMFVYCPMCGRKLGESDKK